MGGGEGGEPCSAREGEAVVIEGVDEAVLDERRQGAITLPYVVPGIVQGGLLHGAAGVPQDGEETAPALAVGARIGLASAGRAVVRGPAGEPPGAVGRDGAVGA